MGKNLKTIVLMLTMFCFVSTVYSSVGDAFMMSQTLKNVEIMKMSAKIKNDLNKAATWINKKGGKAFPKIKKLNDEDKAEIFVIDPKDGDILVAPDAEYKNGQALNEDNINTKVLAEKVRKYRMEVQTDKKGFFSFFTSKDINLYPGGFAARTVITPDWKVYVIFTHKNASVMEKLFVTGAVNSACDIVKEVGLKNAVKLFNKKGSPFRQDDSYIWIYNSDGVLVYNPEYPENEGKNMLKDDDKNFVNYLSSIIEDAKKNGSGWKEYNEIRKPGEPKSKTYPKVVFYQLIKSEGKKYVLGTGLYLESTK